MSRKTVIWIVRALGVAMLIVFAYLLSSMRGRLLQMRQDEQMGGAEVRREAAPTSATPSPAGAPEP